MCGVELGDHIIKSEPHSTSNTVPSSATLSILPATASILHNNHHPTTISFLPSPHDITSSAPPSYVMSSLQNGGQNGACFEAVTSNSMMSGKDMLSLSLVSSSIAPSILIPSLLTGSGSGLLAGSGSSLLSSGSTSSLSGQNQGKIIEKI